MRKIICLAIILLALICFKSYAELSVDENEVIFYMNFLQEMSYTAEYTEGMEKKHVEQFLTENIEKISKTYKISIDDIYRLMLHKQNGKSLPARYKGPATPTAEEKKALFDAINKSIQHYSQFSKYSGMPKDIPSQ